MHGRGALDPKPVTSQDAASIPLGGIAPSPFSTGIVNPRAEVRPTNESLCCSDNSDPCFSKWLESRMYHKLFVIKNVWHPGCSTNSCFS